MAKPGFFLFIFIVFRNLIINDKSVYGVLGTRTQGGRMEGADESTELCLKPFLNGVDQSIPRTGMGISTV